MVTPCRKGGCDWVSWGFEAVEVVRVLRARGCDSAGNIDYSVFFGKLGQTSAVDELAMSAAGVGYAALST